MVGRELERERREREEEELSAPTLLMLVEAADRIRGQPSTTLSSAGFYDSSEDNFSNLTSNPAGPLHSDGFGRQVRTPSGSEY